MARSPGTTDARRQHDREIASGLRNSELALAIDVTPGQMLDRPKDHIAQKFRIHVRPHFAGLYGILDDSNEH